MAALRTGERLADVVVTAMASTTAVAPDAEETWRRLLEGRSGIRKLDNPFIVEFDLPVRIGGSLREDFDSHLNRVELRRFAFMEKMATVLSRRLWDQAGSPEVDTNRLMVSVGTGLGSTEDIPHWHDIWKVDGLRAVSPLSVQKYMPNAPAAVVGLERKARAGVVTSVMADASGTAAVAQAWRNIVLGEADIAICGGIETVVEAVPVAAFSQLELLSSNNDDPPGACRPFDKHRDGMVLGEGGALMVVETETHAKTRRAPILARLMGAAITSDGYDVVNPDPTGERAGDAIARAVEVAGLSPTDIDHVNAHGAGTTLGDVAEARAMRRALGDHKPAVYAPKAALGNSLGAAGAVEAVLTVQALRDGIVPPTLNFDTIDPEIDLDIVAGAPRRDDYRYAVSQSFSLGGNNVALVFGAA
jgi:3-oxoacyl-[acyl-carrier-protein] synthase II/beta-ketoacyl ACP synthase